MDEDRGSGSIQGFGLGVWRVVCTSGAIRLFVVLLAAGIAYSVMGNTAGRIIGAVLLLGALDLARRQRFREALVVAS